MTPQEFKQARRRLGLSSAALADLLGVHPTTVRKWEAPPGSVSARKPNPVAVRMLKAMVEKR